VMHLLSSRTGNFLVADGLMSFDEVNERIWSVGAEVFVPAAASRLVTKDYVEQLIAHGLEVISSGANVPFADEIIFYGPIAQFADNVCAVVPDFIANSGMARTYFYLQGNGADLTDRAIFDDISHSITAALRNAWKRNSSKVRLAETALTIALEQL
jgi:glutamate dehydrogenase/leucine dehydrogenase